MQTDPLIYFRILSALGLAVTVGASAWAFRNSGRFFGLDAEVPSENASARSYSRLLFAAVFVHAFIFFASGLLFL